MKLSLLLCSWVVPVLAQAQTVKNNAIVIGQVDSVISAVLKETRKVWVSVPASASDPTYAKQRYPVMYLLDGDRHFVYTSGMIERFSRVTNKNEVVQLRWTV